MNYGLEALRAAIARRNGLGLRSPIDLGGARQGAPNAYGQSVANNAQAQRAATAPAAPNPAQYARQPGAIAPAAAPAKPVQQQYARQPAVPVPAAAQAQQRASLDRVAAAPNALAQSNAGLAAAQQQAAGAAKPALAADRAAAAGVPRIAPQPMAPENQALIGNALAARQQDTARADLARRPDDETKNLWGF